MGHIKLWVTLEVKQAQQFCVWFDFFFKLSWPPETQEIWIKNPPHLRPKIEFPKGEKLINRLLGIVYHTKFCNKNVDGFLSTAYYSNVNTFSYRS